MSHVLVSKVAGRGAVVDLEVSGEMVRVVESDHDGNASDRKFGGQQEVGGPVELEALDIFMRSDMPVCFE